MKRITNKQYVQAYMEVLELRGGIADLTRKLYGDDCESGGPEYRWTLKRKMELQKRGVRLPEFKDQPPWKEAEALNKIIESY